MEMAFDWISLALALRLRYVVLAVGEILPIIRYLRKLSKIQAAG